MEIVPLIVLAILILGFAFLALANNYKSHTNRLFASFAVAMVIWIASNYFSNTLKEYNAALLANRAIFFSTSFLVWFLYLFAKVYPNNQLIISKKKWYLGWLITLTMSTVSLFTPLIVQNITIYPDYSDITFGDGVYIYVVFFLFYFGLFTVSLYKKVKYSKGGDRLRIQYLLFGVLATGLGAITTNLILPLIFGIFSLSNIGPGFLVLFVGMTAYSIVRHRFLDIRILVGRIVYYFTLSTLPYFLFFFLVALYTTLFGGVFNPTVYFVSLFVVIVFVFAFNWLNEFIRTQVNSRLINPGYNPLETAEKLSNDLSVMIDLPRITDNILAVLSRTIRPSFSTVVVFADKDHSQDRVYSSDKLKPQPDIQKLKETIITLWQAVGKHPIVLDEIEAEMLDGIYRNVPNIARELKPLMEELNAKVIVSLGEQENILGIYIIGQKEADSPYTTSDIDFLKSIGNTAAVAIQRSLLYSEVQEFANTLQLKVDQATADLQKSNKDLEATLAQLQEIRRQERDMIDVMGHELRTPISIVRNALVMLERLDDQGKGAVAPADLKKYLDMSLESSRREITLIETLLSATKVDNARIQLYFVKSDMVDMLDDAMEGQKTPISQKNLDVKFVNRPSEPIWVYADRTRAQEIIDNFLSNAVKYTLEGSVTITTWKDDKFGWASVSDTGIGISEEDLQNLGKKFFRAKQHIPKTNGSSTEVVRPGGTGLGLYVTFDLIKIMGGSLYINSKVGEGTTFTYSLPLYTNQPDKQVDQTFDNSLASTKSNVFLNSADVPKPPQ